MTCEYCTDPDGEACFPVYGIGPHRHEGEHMIGSTVLLDKAEWPANYREDADCPGMGVWWCAHCGDGKPDDAPIMPEKIAAKLGEHIEQFLRRAAEQAKATNRELLAVHNGTETAVKPDSNADDLCAAWWRICGTRTP